MAATKENPIVFYDIFSKQGPWSPNTYKTRLTLNYKRLPYRVKYISIADIQSKLKELGVPPSTHNPLFQYTLPMIADPSSEPGGKPTYVTESFNIATYLDDKYPAPEYPAVLPPGTRILQSIVTDHITQLGMHFTLAVLPFASVRDDLLDERGLEYFVRSRSAIIGVELPKLVEKAPENWKAAEIQWNKFNEVFEYNKEGPFVMGRQISFVDFVIGGIIHLIRTSEGGSMSYWGKMAEWHNGRWANLWREIEKIEADSSAIE
ncbi:glutathione S-transferase [Ceratobasidium sp. AG-Ba]|nr:glutathione S-transferase [Ceratobasidium sp. AG-Ba]